jgi:hypothetical protein
VYEDFAAFTNGNYKAYRETVKCAEPPCLPYLGIDPSPAARLLHSAQAVIVLIVTSRTQEYT